MAGLETAVDQFPPDKRQLVNLRPEQVNPLTACDLGVEVVFLRDLPQRDQLVRRDLPCRDARHDGIRAVLLNVGQKAVVGVLQRCVRRRKHMVVPARRQDRRDGGLADIATQAPTVPLDQLVERGDAFPPDEVVQLLARVREMLAEVGV